MNNNYVNKKIKVITVTIFFLVLLLFSYFVITHRINGKNTYNKSNILRILVNPQLEEIKEMFNRKRYYSKKEFYNFDLLDLSGNILFSSNNNFNGRVDLEKDIGYDNAFTVENNSIVRYSVPLMKNDIQSGIVTFYIPYEKIYSNNNKEMILVYILVLLIVSLLIKINRIIKIDILYPLREVHKSSKTILNGDYSYRVNYDYHGEIGSLCHDFECMREELNIYKKNEEELRLREKELLACISHDLKTPLSSIIGYVEGIKDGIVKDKDGIERYSNVILKRSKEMSKLIDDILEQSKIELNEMSINKKEIYVDKYLLDVLEEVNLDISRHNIKLIYSKDIPQILVLIDPFRIRQVINNIIYNSVKYSKINGIIEIFIVNGEKDININIKDYGEGISTEDIPFVFNKFYRGDIHRDTNIPGSGLGLSISKHIIECHGGTINCVSSIKEGTLISFTIPKL